MAGEPAERASGLRSGDAVDGDVRPFLEPADRLCGRRTVEPVDRAPVEAMRTQADLEGGDARIGCRGARGEGRDGKDQGQSEERSGKHGRTVFAVSAGIP